MRLANKKGKTTKLNEKDLEMKVAGQGSTVK